MGTHYEALLIKRYGYHVLVIVKDLHREIWAVFSNRSDAKAWIIEHLNSNHKGITESQLPEGGKPIL